MPRNKFLFAGLPATAEWRGAARGGICQFASLKINWFTGLLVNRLTILLLCFLCLFSISLAQEQFVYDARGKRDPFIPLVTPEGRLLKLDREETSSGLLLEGIIYDEHGLSYAIVNGEVVNIGDKAGDYQVLKIEKNKVIFIKGGQTTEVQLKEEEL